MARSNSAHDAKTLAAESVIVRGEKVLGLGGMSLVLLGGMGAWTETPLLGGGLILAGGVLFARRATVWNKPIALIDVWLVGFLYMFFLEWASRESIITTFGLEYAAQTEGYTVAAFGAVLVGYWRATRRGFRGQPHRGSGGATQVVERRSLPNGLISYSALVAMSTFIAAAAFIGFRTLVAEGRQARYEIGVSSLLVQAIGLGLIATPILLGMVLVAPAAPKGVRLSAMVGVALSLLALVGSGSRFPLGFAAGALIFLGVMRGAQLRRKDLRTLVVGGVLLMGAQVLMMASRSVGFAQFISELQAKRTESAGAAGLQAEGLLRVTAVAMRAQQELSDRGTLEHFFLVYWWVPREMWPEKPTMAGHWLMREYDDGRGFSEAHSFSGGFAFAPLIDFGPVLGVVCCTLYGLLLGLAERALWRARYEPLGAIHAFLAPLVFGVFFMLRSPFTAAIVLQSLWLVTALPLWVLSRLGPRRATGWRPDVWTVVSGTRSARAVR